MRLLNSIPARAPYSSPRTRTLTSTPASGRQTGRCCIKPAVRPCSSQRLCTPPVSEPCALPSEVQVVLPPACDACCMCHAAIVNRLQPKRRTAAPLSRQGATQISAAQPQLIRAWDLVRDLMRCRPSIPRRLHSIAGDGPCGMRCSIRAQRVRRGGGAGSPCPRRPRDVRPGRAAAARPVRAVAPLLLQRRRHRVHRRPPHLRCIAAIALEKE